MNDPLTISASILAADFTCLRDQVLQAVDAGADWIHVDVMDGHFVPNITFGPLIVETCRRITNLPLDVHLMIEHPERYIEDFASAGATNLTIHIEGSPNIHRTLGAIHALKVNPAIVLNPGTPASSLESILPLVNMVLVMTVNPGFGGQKFLHPMLEKIRQVRAMLDEVNPAAQIEVDGGIAENTMPLVYAAGARVFVAGNSIFNHPLGIAEGIQALRQAVPA